VKHLSDYLEPEQVHAMLDAAKMGSQRDYLIIKTLWRRECGPLNFSR
jgi:hypothetical protein